MNVNSYNYNNYKNQQVIYTLNHASCLSNIFQRKIEYLCLKALKPISTGNRVYYGKHINFMAKAVKAGKKIEEINLNKGQSLIEQMIYAIEDGQKHEYIMTLQAKKILESQGYKITYQASTETTHELIVDPSHIRIVSLYEFQQIIKIFQEYIQKSGEVNEEKRKELASYLFSTYLFYKFESININKIFQSFEKLNTEDKDRFRNKVKTDRILIIHMLESFLIVQWVKQKKRREAHKKEQLEETKELNNEIRREEIKKQQIIKILLNHIRPLNDQLLLRLLKKIHTLF